MSESDGFTVGTAADGNVRLHFKNEVVAVGFDIPPQVAKRLGSTLQSEAHHANEKGA